MNIFFVQKSDIPIVLKQEGCKVLLVEGLEEYYLAEPHVHVLPFDLHNNWVPALLKLVGFSSYRWHNKHPNKTLFNSIQDQLHNSWIESNCIFKEFLLEQEKHLHCMFENKRKSITGKTKSVLLHKDFNLIPVIICGSGPSLARKKDCLLAFSNKALIVAAGPTTACSLQSMGIEAHVLAMIDPNEEQYRRAHLYNDIRVTVFHRLRLQSNCLDLFSGQKILFQEEQGYPLASFFNDVDKDMYVPSLAGENVVVWITQVFLWMGFKNLIFSGTDFAFSEGKGQASSHNSKRPKYIKVDGMPTKTKDLFGKDIWTLYKWEREAKSLSKLIHKYPKCNFFNLSYSGLGISGVDNILPEALEKKACFRQRDIQSFLWMVLHGKKKDLQPKGYKLKRLKLFQDSIHKSQEYLEKYNKKKQIAYEALLHAEEAFYYLLAPCFKAWNVLKSRNKDHIQFFYTQMAPKILATSLLANARLIKAYSQ